MWEALHPGEPIENVRLYLPDEDKAIDIALRFHGKDQDSPRLTLSEGYRHSLGLCIFLALAKREAGNDRPLILDDVVVSLDRNHRGMIVDLLTSQFADRQVILFTHDRDWYWYAELRHQLGGKQWGFKALLPYETPELGICWSEKTITVDEARANLKERPDWPATIGTGGSRGGAEERVKKIGMAAITVAALLSLSHARADDITGDILHEDCIVASHGSGSDRDCDIYINGLAAGVLVDQVAREQGTPICFPPRIKAEQICKAVEKFVQAHPDMLQVNGITIVGFALSDAFPCSKSN